MRTLQTRLAVGAAAVAICLSACDNEQAPTSLSGIQSLVPTEVAPGQSIGLGVLIGATPADDVRWRQTAGPTVVFHAERGKLIGFDVPSEGEYAFEVVVRTEGVEHAGPVRFTARGSRPAVNARLDRAVVQRGSSSLRATHDFGENEAVTYRWEQTQGPTASVERTDQALLLFEAPRVETDTLLTFRVTVSDSRGRSAADEAWVLVEATTINDTAIFWTYADMVTGRVYPYDEAGPYATDLGSCLYSNTLHSPCRLDKLPFIAQETLDPSVADIMRRVTVSHPWMARRFEEFLTQADTHGDVRKLLRAVTGIVIAADIRPSFYWAATGGIYLDPDNLWLTPEERDTIHETPDYRSEFDRELEFVMPWRLVRNNDYVSYYYPSDWRATRSLADTRDDLASLLYHELAHANDALPPALWPSLSGLQTPLSAMALGETSSQVLAETSPLGSTEMRDLAAVAFAGATATELQKSYRPPDIAAFFAPDLAADFYSYSDTAEDFAELFSFLLLRYRHSIDADIAVTNHPRGDDVSGADYLVTWGQRGRIGEPRFADRLRLVAERVLPDLDIAAALASLPAPLPMRPGENWVENLDLGGTPGLARQPDAARLRRALQRPVLTLPRHRHLPGAPIGE